MLLIPLVNRRSQPCRGGSLRVSKKRITSRNDASTGVTGIARRRPSPRSPKPSANIRQRPGRIAGMLEPSRPLTQPSWRRCEQPGKSLQDAPRSVAIAGWPYAKRPPGEAAFSTTEPADRSTGNEGAEFPESRRRSGREARFVSRVMKVNIRQSRVRRQPIVGRERCALAHASGEGSPVIDRDTMPWCALWLSSDKQPGTQDR